mmetsp:Transcript_23577/g.47705  ORF Transcript_23577/g.47705 Transcript_23577/m.47705 type:complete len:97 (-) Transcript_23577:449-739(-)
MITDNKQQMDKPFDPNKPFANYTKCFERCLQLANDAGTPHTNKQLLQIGVVAMTKCGIFTEGYLRWTSIPAPENTWANFKSHFNAEHTWRGVTHQR